MKVISTQNAPAAIGPYSQGLNFGNLVFVSGQIPVDPKTGLMAESIEEQAKQSLTNLKSILAAEGLEMKNVIKTVVFLADLADFPKVNAVYETFFTAPYPARSCVAVKTLPKNVLCEVEAIAYLG